MRELVDPFVTVAATNVRKKVATQTKQPAAATSVSPTYNETFRIPIPRTGTPPAATPPPQLTVECCARDARSPKHEETIGVVHVPLDSLLPFNAIHDVWYTLKPAKQGDAVSGAIHLKFVRFPPRPKAALTIGKAPRPEMLLAAVDAADLYALVLGLDSKLDPNVLDKHHETPLHKVRLSQGAIAFIPMRFHPLSQTDSPFPSQGLQAVRE
jgi:hypothetical protein